MIRNYTVFSADATTVSAPLTLSTGAVIQAEVPAFVVQLMPAEPENGTIRLVLTGESSSDLFTPGRAIQITLAGV